MRGVMRWIWQCNANCSSGHRPPTAGARPAASALLPSPGGTYGKYPRLEAPCAYGGSARTARRLVRRNATRRPHPPTALLHRRQIGAHRRFSCRSPRSSFRAILTCATPGLALRYKIASSPATLPLAAGRRLRYSFSVGRDDRENPVRLVADRRVQCHLHGCLTPPLRRKSDSGMVESRTERITEASDRTSHPLRRYIEPPAPNAQPLAVFAKDEVTGPRLGGAGNPRQAGGTPRIGLPAPIAKQFSARDLHTHAMAAIASLPLPVLFVYQEHWSNTRAHSVSSGATVSRSAGFVRLRSKPPCLITLSLCAIASLRSTQPLLASPTRPSTSPPVKEVGPVLAFRCRNERFMRPPGGALRRSAQMHGRHHPRSPSRPSTLANVSPPRQRTLDPARCRSRLVL